MLDFGYYNMDCMEGMKEFPDKYFDLAIVDPPYGINIKTNMGRRKTAKDNSNLSAQWDSAIPGKEYFDELFRVSKKQVIWGGNYFYLPPTKCFLIWRKPQISEEVSFSMCEYAWTNLDGTAKEWVGISNERDRFHPTQKPIALYEWILSRYAKEGNIILDTHVGSASSLIACYRANHRYVGFELDQTYYRLSKQRLDEEKRQMRIQYLDE